MNPAADRLSRTLLYEGYSLYPYRASALKNRQAWTFGGLCPESWSRATDGAEPCSAQTELLVQGTEGARLGVALRFLQAAERGEDDPAGSHTARPEAVEREVNLRDHPLHGPLEHAQFSVPIEREATGGIQRRREALEGWIEVSGTTVGEGLVRVRVLVGNATPLEVPAGRLSDPQAILWRQASLRRTFAAAHLVLGVAGGRFVSLLEPPEELTPLAAACQHRGLWPVLIGDREERDAMIAAPIVLYDYPQLAAESPGDLFDATEIDEILTLRILTLTEEERREAAADAHVRRLLARTEGLGDEERERLHGAARGRRPLPPAPTVFRPGSRVRLRPRRRADILDVVLCGKLATVQSVQEDFEGRLLLAVTLDEDPGRDLGLEGRPGHRFFFECDEVDPLTEAPPP